MILPTITDEKLNVTLVEASNLPPAGSGGAAFTKAIAAGNAAAQASTDEDRVKHNDASIQHWQDAISQNLDPLREGYAFSRLGAKAIGRRQVSSAVEYFLKALAQRDVLYETAHEAAQYLAIIYREEGRSQEAAMLQSLFSRTHAKLGHELSPAEIRFTKEVVREARAVFSSDGSLNATGAGMPIQPHSSQAPASLNLQVARGGEVLGSYEPAELRRLVASGEVVAEDYYWSEGMADWQLVGDIDWTAYGIVAEKVPAKNPQLSRPSVAEPVEKRAVARETWNWKFFGAWCGVLIACSFARQFGLQSAVYNFSHSLFRDWNPTFNSAEAVKILSTRIVPTFLLFGAQALLLAFVFRLANWKNSGWWFGWWMAALLPFQFIVAGLQMSSTRGYTIEEMPWFRVAVSGIPIGLLLGVSGWLALRRKFRAADLWLLGNAGCVLVSAFGVWISAGGTRMVPGVVMLLVNAFVSAACMTWVISFGVKDRAERTTGRAGTEGYGVTSLGMPGALKVLRFLLVYLLPLRLLKVFAILIGTSQIPRLNSLIMILYCVCVVSLTVYGFRCGLRLRSRPAAGLSETKVFFMLTIALAMVTWALPFYGDLPRDADLLSKIYRQGGLEALGVSVAAVGWFCYLAVSKSVKIWATQAQNSA